MRTLILLLATIIFASCVKENHVYEYDIKEGKHKSKGRLITKDFNTFKFTVPVEFIDPISTKAISKIWGYSDALHHHKNSMRIGVMQSKESDQLIFFAYYYQDSERGWTEIGRGYAGYQYEAEIRFTDDYYIVRFETNTVYIERKGKGKKGYTLKPYYGGQDPAPREMTFKIEF